MAVGDPKDQSSSVDPALAKLLAAVMGNAGADGSGREVQNVVLLPTGPFSYQAGNPQGGSFANTTMTEQQAQAYYMRMTKDELNQLSTFYQKFGKGQWESPKSMWAAAVGASVNSGSTPWQVMEQAQTQASVLADPAAAGTQQAAYDGPMSSMTLTGATSAEEILTNALRQYLGRQATPAELAGFKAQLNATEQANPTVVTPDGPGAAYRTGGTDSGVIARDYAMSRPDYAETQASTTLMGWLTDAVKGAKSERIV
jgi:hypothetical protein